MVKHCNATGKACFYSYAEARANMLAHKAAYKLMRNSDGKRIKHRQGKPDQKRIYLCPFCKLYHQTRWDAARIKEVKQNWSNSISLKERFYANVKPPFAVEYSLRIC